MVKSIDADTLYGYVREGLLDVLYGLGKKEGRYEGEIKRNVNEAVRGINGKVFGKVNEINGMREEINGMRDESE